MSVRDVEFHARLDIALVHLVSPVGETLRVGEAVETDRWTADVRPYGNEPRLTGVISATRWPLKDGTEVLQLGVIERRGEYKGYSGSPVMSRGAVVGVVTRQIRLRPGVFGGPPPDAGNVLYAIPIADALGGFDVAPEYVPRRREPNPVRARLLDSDGPDQTPENDWTVSRPLAHAEHARIEQLAFSEDGSLLATAGTDNARLWNVSAIRPLEPPLGDGPVTRVVFSNDSSRLATATKVTALVWSIGHGRPEPISPDEPLCTSQEPGASVAAIAFSGDGCRVAAAIRSGPSVIWHVDSRRVEPLPSSHAISDVAFSPDGAQLAASGFDGKLRMWDVTAEGFSFPADWPDGKAVRRVQFSPLGHWLVSVAQDGRPLRFGKEPETVRVRNARNGAVVTNILHETRIEAVALSRDDRLVASAGSDGTVQLSMLLPAVHDPVVIPCDSPVNALAFSPDSRRLAGAHDDGSASVWDVFAEREPVPLRPPGGSEQVRDVAFSSKGVVASASGHSAWLWLPPSPAA